MPFVDSAFNWDVAAPKRVRRRKWKTLKNVLALERWRAKMPNQIKHKLKRKRKQKRKRGNLRGGREAPPRRLLHPLRFCFRFRFNLCLIWFCQFLLRFEKKHYLIWMHISVQLPVVVGQKNFIKIPACSDRSAYDERVETTFACKMMIFAKSQN